VVFLKNLVFSGPVNNLGYGIHFTNIAENLVKLFNDYSGVWGKIDLGIVPMNKTIGVSEALERKIAESVEFSYKCPTIFLYHLHGLHNMSGGYRVGYSVFELDDFSKAEMNGITNSDEIWVVSKWAREIVESKSPDKIVRVIPEGVNRQIFNEKDEYVSYRSNFDVNICNIGKFEKRKGHLMLLEALHGIESDASVRLLAKWNNHFIPNFPNYINEILTKHGYKYIENIEDLNGFVALRYESVRKDNVTVDIIVSDIQDHRFVRDLYRSSDFGVFPYFAEGWNLPLLEAISCGLPCIANNYSGPTEYLNKNNHITLKNTRKEIAFDGIFFKGNNGTWMSVDAMEIADKITYCINNMNNMGNIIASGIETADKFTWENAALAMMNVIQNESPFKESVTR